MSTYIERFLIIADPLTDLVSDKKKNHCTKIIEIDEYSKLILTIDDLYIQSGKAQVRFAEN